MEANIQTIMEAALQQGIWAALYIYLFFSNAERKCGAGRKVSGDD